MNQPKPVKLKSVKEILEFRSDLLNQRAITKDPQIKIMLEFYVQALNAILGLNQFDYD